MGVYGAMITAVSGLRAQSYALENISGNIANSQTTGFKRLDTSFVDLVPDAPSQREVSGSVLAYSRGTNTIQGAITNTQVGTNVAINGEGYFIVAERSDFAGGNPVFDGVDYFTRRGDFELDRNGYLVNGSGYYLKGFSIDPTTGTTTGSTAGVIRVSRDQLPARATTTIEYRANLPANPRPPGYDSSVAGSEFLNPAVYTTDPIATGTVVGADELTFINQTIDGGRIPVYSDNGTPANLSIRWAKLADGTWASFAQVQTGAAAGATAWQRIGPNPTAATGDTTFNAAGQLTSAATFAIPALTIDGVPINGLTMTSVGGGVTQYDTATGLLQTSTIRQDGYSAGELNKVTVDPQGRIVGTYSNGQVLPLAQITIAQFNADNMLKRKEGGVFEQTLESGAPLVGQSGSSFVSGALESSNTDIAEEFSRMIVTQQAYSANTRVITTAQQMLQDTINIIR